MLVVRDRRIRVQFKESLVVKQQESRGAGEKDSRGGAVGESGDVAGGMRGGGDEVQDRYGSTDRSNVDRYWRNWVEARIRNRDPDDVSEGRKRKADPAILSSRNIFPEVVTGI